jgi:hypothetical protein
LSAQDQKIRITTIVHISFNNRIAPIENNAIAFFSSEFAAPPVTQNRLT